MNITIKDAIEIQQYLNKFNLDLSLQKWGDENKLVNVKVFPLSKHSITIEDSGKLFEVQKFSISDDSKDIFSNIFFSGIIEIKEHWLYKVLKTKGAIGFDKEVLLTSERMPENNSENLIVEKLVNILNYDSLNCNNYKSCYLLEIMGEKRKHLSFKESFEITLIAYYEVMRFYNCPSVELDILEQTLCYLDSILYMKDKENLVLELQNFSILCDALPNFWENKDLLNVLNKIIYLPETFDFDAHLFVYLRCNKLEVEIFKSDFKQNSLSININQSLFFAQFNPHKCVQIKAIMKKCTFDDNNIEYNQTLLELMLFGSKNKNVAFCSLLDKPGKYMTVLSVGNNLENITSENIVKNLSVIAFLMNKKDYSFEDIYLKKEHLESIHLDFCLKDEIAINKPLKNSNKVLKF